MSQKSRQNGRPTYVPFANAQRYVTAGQGAEIIGIARHPLRKDLYWIFAISKAGRFGFTQGLDYIDETTKERNIAIIVMAPEGEKDAREFVAKHSPEEGGWRRKALEAFDKSLIAWKSGHMREDVDPGVGTAGESQMNNWKIAYRPDATLFRELEEVPRTFHRYTVGWAVPSDIPGAPPDRYAMHCEGETVSAVIDQIAAGRDMALIPDRARRQNFGLELLSLGELLADFVGLKSKGLPAYRAIVEGVNHPEAKAYLLADLAATPPSVAEGVPEDITAPRAADVPVAPVAAAPVEDTLEEALRKLPKDTIIPVAELPEVIRRAHGITASGTIVEPAGTPEPSTDVPVASAGLVFETSLEASPAS